MDNMSSAQIAPTQARGASEQLAKLEVDIKGAQSSLNKLAPVLNDIQIKFAKTDQERIDNIAEQVRVGSNIDVGCIICFAGEDNVPEGYLKCQHQEISRTDYAELFSVIGTKFGEGDGENTFNLPNISPKLTDDGLKLYYVIKYTSAMPRKLDAYAEVVDGALNITTMYAPDRPLPPPVFTITEDEVNGDSDKAVSGKAVYSAISSLNAKVEEETDKQVNDVVIENNKLIVTYGNGTVKEYTLNQIGG